MKRLFILVFVLILVTGLMLFAHYRRVMLQRAEWDLLESRGIGEIVAGALIENAAEHHGQLPPYEGWRISIEPYLMRVPLHPKARQRLNNALAYYEYSKEVAGKDCSNMLSGETILLTRTRGLPRRTKIEVYLDGLGRITRPPLPFWRRWFRKSTCPYQ